MKHLKTYRIFESQERKELTEEQKEFLNKFSTGVWMFNHNTGLVDLNGNFDCSWKDIKDFFGVRFGKVKGTFDCSYNRLVSLEGAPQKVGGSFFCHGSELTSLQGAPQEVDGYFDCSNSKLTSLAGAPQEVGGDFDCRFNQLTSLEGAPQKVGRGFYCWDNKLTSLKGAPQVVGENFSCSYNRLTSLEGAPQKVGGHFDCSENKLKSLAGAPQEVVEHFKCNAFELKKGEWNLEGWLKVLREGSSRAQKLISTVLSAEYLNKEIAKDPAGMIMKLKPVWNHENFKETRGKLVWPKGYGDEADLVGDLGGVGF